MIAEEFNQWATTRSGEMRLQKYVASTWTSGRVMLIFSPTKSRHFCAVAEVLGLPGIQQGEKPRPPWDTDGVFIGSAFDVVWEVKPSEKHEVAFSQVRGLHMDMLRDMTPLSVGVARRISRMLQDLPSGGSEDRASSDDPPGRSGTVRLLARKVTRDQRPLRRPSKRFSSLVRHKSRTRERFSEWAGRSR